MTRVTTQAFDEIAKSLKLHAERKALRDAQRNAPSLTDPASYVRPEFLPEADEDGQPLDPSGY